jgi:mannosyltransferase
VERRAIRYWLGYGLLAAVGLYVHFFIALVVAAHGIWLLATRQVPRLGALLAAVIPVAVAAVPIPLVALKYGGGHLWIGGVTIRHVMSVLEALTGGLPILLAMIALVVYTLIAQRHKPVLWLAAGTLLFPITATILVSLFKPLLVTRYLVICLPAMAIVAGVALAAIRASAVRWAAVLAVGGLLVAALPQTYADTHQQDWRSAGRWIAHETRAGDQLVIGSWGRRPIEYYINRRHPAVAPDRVALQTATDGGADRVWLVLTNLSAEQRESQINALSGQYEVQEERIFGAKVHVVLMTSRRPAAGAG